MHKELVVRARGTLGISYHLHRVSRDRFLLVFFYSSLASSSQCFAIE